MTTRQVHARIAKKIINMDTQRHNVCCWDDCERDSTVLYRHLQHHHPVNWGCAYADQMALSHGANTPHQWFAFCSERHLQYFVNSQGHRALAMIQSQGRAYGNLPVGAKGGIL